MAGFSARILRNLSSERLLIFAGSHLCSQAMLVLVQSALPQEFHMPSASCMHINEFQEAQPIHVEMVSLDGGKLLLIWAVHNVSHQFQKKLNSCRLSFSKCS